MAYLSKKTLLEAYKVLSTLSENPSAQGATQKVSAIRYALALDMFYKKNNRECDTRDGKDKNEFSNNVCFIVALSDILYTANFYTSVPVHQGDCAVGSNFYSVNAVKNSLTNPTITINYPQRGNNPLFNIQGGKLYQIESYKKNIDFYVSGNSHKFALILWILRNEQLDFSSLYGSIKLQLQRFFTPTMISNLLPTEDNFRGFVRQMRDDKVAVRILADEQKKLQDFSHIDMFYDRFRRGADWNSMYTALNDLKDMLSEKRLKDETQEQYDERMK